MERNSSLNWMIAVVMAVFSVASAVGQEQAITSTAPVDESQPLSPAAWPKRDVDVRVFGAVGDGQADDTKALQQAIDACAAQGGGIVMLDRGTFLTGSLHLRSHVELHLTSTAVLLGATDLAGYYVDSKVVYKQLSPALLYAQDCEQVAITGQGTIDGQGRAFPHGERDQRPVLIRLRDCRQVRMEGILVKNAASFAVHPIHCQQVRIDGLRIDSHVQPNSDGIDIDGCQDVFIANCNIRSGDDSIALKTIEKGAPCRDIVITNCILSSECAGIRIGPDAMENIERVCVTNCVIRDTGLNGIKIQSAFGVVMRDMVFSNMIMDNVTGPISLRLAGWELGAGNVWAVFDDSNWPHGQLRNILFDNIRARVPADRIKSCISITGTRQTRPQAITFSNLDITFAGGGTTEEAARREVPDLERDYPECFIFGVLPAYALYVHHADGITLNNVQFRLDAEDVRPAIVCDDVKDFSLTAMQADSYPGTESLIRLQNTQAALLTGNRALRPVAAFLRVEGEQSQRISLSGNQLDLASQIISTADNVPPAALRTTDRPSGE